MLPGKKESIRKRGHPSILKWWVSTFNIHIQLSIIGHVYHCLLYTSPSPRDSAVYLVCRLVL
ncbi:MAG: hypothetical protein QUT30_14700, partial [Acidobacteriota bacterium]|nr:hypothetical protein [Acidobacteriota bacterium]